MIIDKKEKSPTSYTMSLARGIRLRDTRELKARPMNLLDAMHDIMFALDRGLKPSKFEKHCATMQAKRQASVYFYGPTDPNDNRGTRTRVVCAVTPAYGNTPGFEPVILRPGKHGLEDNFLPIRFSHHALERIIYRRRLPNLRQAVTELMSALSEITTVTNLMLTGRLSNDTSTYVRTPNGFAILDIDTLDSGLVNVVSWCTSQQEMEDQGTIQNVCDIVFTLAKENNMSPVDFMMAQWEISEREAVQTVAAMVKQRIDFATGNRKADGLATPASPLGRFL